MPRATADVNLELDPLAVRQVALEALEVGRIREHRATSTAS
jgi:hypothetical protein